MLLKYKLDEDEIDASTNLKSSQNVKNSALKTQGKNQGSFREFFKTRRLQVAKRLRRNQKMTNPRLGTNPKTTNRRQVTNQPQGNQLIIIER